MFGYWMQSVRTTTFSWLSKGACALSVSDNPPSTGDWTLITIIALCFIVAFCAIAATVLSQYGLT